MSIIPALRRQDWGVGDGVEDGGVEGWGARGPQGQLGLYNSSLSQINKDHSNNNKETESLDHPASTVDCWDRRHVPLSTFFVCAFQIIL